MMQLNRTASVERTGAPRTRREGPVLISGALALLAAISVLAACSSSKAKSSSSVSPPHSTAGTGQGSGSAADMAAIKDAYRLLFAISTPLDKSVSLLQDGEAFRTTLTEESKTTYAKQASASVSKVDVTSANRATVTFSILLNGSPILPDQKGFAVRENGVWKVAGVTFCGLLAAQGNPPAACTRPAATSLPS